ncbi:unnamed protein product [Victoria cruziana]
MTGKRCRNLGEGWKQTEESESDDVDYIPDADLVIISSGNSSGSEEDYDEAQRYRKKKIANGKREKKKGRITNEKEDKKKKIMNEKGGKRKRGKKSDKILLGWQVIERELEESLVGIQEACELDPSLRDDGMHETMETPDELVMPLLRFQQEWLAWAVKQEQSELRGGVLADEMGMGKTVQAISLVLASRNKSPASTSKVSTTKCTLVICPLVAAIQWINEIGRFTVPGSTKVLLYHGPNRTKNIKDFVNYDFVVTTYSTVESDYRKNVMPDKEKCIWCGKLFYHKRMIVHLRYFCGPDARKTTKQSKQERKKNIRQSKSHDLKSVAVDETDQIATGRSQLKFKSSKGRAFTSESSEVHVEEGPSNGGNSHSAQSPLHSIKWERIILDEAHYIKDRRCNTAKAVFALESTYKWALSGTPLQNRVGELYSLVRYLQVYPYSYYFCKDCDCRILDYRFESAGDKCSTCNHTGGKHFCWWNKYVTKPIQRWGYKDDGKKAMVLLKHKILKHLVLRRTKKGRSADLVLPPKTVILRRDYMDIVEEDFYEAMYTQSQSQFNRYVAKGTVLNNYAHIFDLLVRLRQAVNHPYLVVHSSRSDQDENADSQLFCGLCGLASDDPVVTSCHHVFCRECLQNFCKEQDQCICPNASCTKRLTLDFHESRQDISKSCKRSSILNRILLDDFKTSTKIDALKEEIRFMIEKDGAAKAIVFSQFTSFLELIHFSLHKSGVKCVLLVGSMSIKARDDAIKMFTDDPECRVFLMSLKAGGVALNLTVASNVFLMDPWWNPAVEQQAQDRIHRIGQYKPIRVVRFVIANTIEERILKLQEKKKLVFEGTVGGSSEALGRLSLEDLHFLFQV